MASVFLSYVREDLERAAEVASALEDAGHSVWWDRHIRGGTEFAKEIERALNSADRVVVLWSATAIASRWVRDEAAFGADSGRLVPVTIDGTEPPLGFRQFHSVDLSRSKHGLKGQQLQRLLEAVESSATEQIAGAPTAPRGPTASSKRLLMTASGAAVAVIAAAGLLLIKGHATTPIVAVQPASPDVLSIAAARDLSVKLGAVPTASSSGFQLTTEPSESKRADLLLQVGARKDGTTASSDLMVTEGRRRSILWAAHFEQPAAEAADLNAQLGVTAARVLSCASDTLSTQGRKLQPSTAKLYLSACAKLAEEYDESTPNVLAAFEKVVAEADWFAPAWAKLLYAEGIYNAGNPDRPVQSQLRRHVATVKRLGIDVAEMGVAEAALLPSNDFRGKIDAIQGALERDRENAILHLTLAEALMNVGRQGDAIEHALRASELDPISPRTLSQYAFVLAHSGRTQQALEVLNRAERLWPGANTVQFARFSFHLRYGDPHIAQQMLRQGGARWGAESVEAYLNARLSPTRSNVDRAVNLAEQTRREFPSFIIILVQTLATFGRTEEALHVLLEYRYPSHAGYNSEPLFRPYLTKVRADPRFIKAMAQMGFVTYWRKSGNWPDFCFDPQLPYDCKREAAKYRT